MFDEISLAGYGIWLENTMVYHGLVGQKNTQEVQIFTIFQNQLVWW